MAAFADAIGLFPQFSDLMSDPQTSVGAILACMGFSALFDCVELVIKPDLAAGHCGDDENTLT
ncbi:hypothetical protein ACIPPQ_20045 [Sphingopyxis sp. LARHCG72]